MSENKILDTAKTLGFGTELEYTNIRIWPIACIRMPLYVSSATGISGSIRTTVNMRLPFLPKMDGPCRSITRNIMSLFVHAGRIISQPMFEGSIR